MDDQGGDGDGDGGSAGSDGSAGRGDAAEQVDLAELVRGPGARPLTALALVAPTAAEVTATTRGVVSSPDTINYRTHAPEPRGLFDAAIFGPFVEVGADASSDDTEVEPFWFGRHRLAVPVLHPLLLRLDPSWAAARAGVGVDVLIAMAMRADSTPADAVPQLAERCPELVVVELPILPAMLRPMRRLPENRWASSDLNDLYRRVINRSNRCARLLELAAPEIITRNEARMLQEAVATLFENPHTATPVTDPQKRALVSLIDEFSTGGGWDAIEELDRRVVADAGALARPLPFRLRATAARLYALGLDLQPKRATRARPSGLASGSGTMPIPVPFGAF